MAARQIIVAGAMPSRDANGRALPALFRFYMPSSGGVPATVYTDEALTVPHEFPIRSDSGGRWPQIWAEEDQLFDVGWSDQVHDANIATYSNIKPLSDALLASADIANAAADAAIAAKVTSEEIAEKFGDMDAAITAAQAAQAGAEGAEAGTEEALASAIEARDLALQYRNQAKEYRDQAQEIAGFDPSTYLNTGAAQAFNEAAKKQGRDNIEAQPVLGVVDRQKVATAEIVGGVLTLNASQASVWAVEWDQDITSLVINGWSPGTDQQTLSLWLIAAGGAGYVFGPTFKPLNGSLPTLSDDLGAENLLHFTTRNAGGRVCYSLSGFFPA